VIVLDTTVLVYAKGADHALRDPSRRLIAAVADGSVEATTTVEVIQEFAHVRARRYDAAEAAALAREYAELLAPLILVTPEQLDRGLTMFERSGSLGAFDSVLAAAALDGGADRLVSADRAFATISDLHHVFPDTAGVAGLLDAT
jgi:predicted nucleic acid-binding protein